MPRVYGYTTRQLEMLVAALNWLVYKSIYHPTAAKHLKADPLIEPPNDFQGFRAALACARKLIIFHLPYHDILKTHVLHLQYITMQFQA